MRKKGEIKMNKYKRDYLHEQERKDMMMFATLMGGVEHISNVWYERGIITKDMRKWLKTAHTYLMKFFETKTNELNDNEVKKLLNRLQDFDVVLLENVNIKKMREEAEKENEWVKLYRDEFEDWCEEIMNVECKNCKKHHSQCKLHEIFVGNRVPESDFKLENCRYAYKETKIEKNFEKIKEFEEYKKSKRGA